MNRKILIGVGSMATVAAIGLGSSMVFAQGNSQTFAQELAAKLGLDESKVQTALNDIRGERKATNEANFQAKLDQAVKDGKLTSAQEQAIIAKRKELAASRQQNMDALKNMTPQQRRDEMNKKRQELDDWAKQNGIDKMYLFGVFGRGGRGFGIRHFK